MNADRMSVELNLAAAIALLSSSALRGATPAKAKALRLHLHAISQATDITVDLRSMAANLLSAWEAVQCTPSAPPAELAPAVWMACSTTSH